MSSLIQVKELYRYYGNHCAVNNVSFKLEKGQILGFLGPNGAGKSSTMQMICGNLAPTAGEILIQGIDILDLPKEAKRYLGYLPETPPIYRELTVDEYLTYCAQLHRIPSKTIKGCIKRAKTRTGLSSSGSRLIGNLSKGYQQRVGIAQAIVHNPAVVVLDEPTVGLDPVQIREIRHLIRELGEEHGVILSTHILPEVQEVCTHVQIINKGHLVLNTSIAGLEHSMGASSLILATRNSIDSDKLLQLPGIKRVEALGDLRYRIFHEQTHSPAEQLANVVVNAGWGLQELSPEKMNMEQIFIDLTQAANAATVKEGSS